MKRVARWQYPLLLAGLAAVLALLLSVSWFRIYFAHPGNDQAWILYVAGQILGGTTLYGPRLTDVNPPLIFWFSGLPMLVASGLHVPAILVLRVLVTAMIFASVAWCLRILRAAGLAVRPAVASLWGLALLAAELSQHGNDYGQREQLLMALLLPYLLYAVVEDGLAPTARFGLAERIALGAAAGLGVCFKPQDALLVVTFELFLVAWTRQIRQLRRLVRPELVVLVLMGGVYLAAVWLFAPGYLKHNVPLLADTYWAFGEFSATEILKMRTVFNLLFVAALLAWVGLRRRLRYPLAPPALLAGALGAALAFAAQNKNWPYQFFPQQTLLACALGWLAIEIAAPWIATAWNETSLPRWTLPALTLLFTVAALPVFLKVGNSHEKIVSQSPGSEYMDKILAGYPAKTPVLLLDTRLVATSDVLEDNLTWASRYAHLWMIPAIVHSRMAEAGGPAVPVTLSPARVQELTDLQRSTVAEDLGIWKPTAVLVARCPPTEERPCQGLNGISFDILAWLEESPAFAAEWKSYRRKTGDAYFDVYERVR